MGMGRCYKHNKRLQHWRRVNYHIYVALCVNSHCKLKKKECHSRMVYVINQYGQPLMPTRRHGKVKHLLNSNKAKVIKRCPFTIQLLFDTTNHTQEISLGIDAGTKHIGISATTANNVLFEGTIQLRTDIQDLLATRRNLRSARRNRKTRYRKARFINRKKDKGWVAPSIQNKINTHIKIINLVNALLPITNQTIEVAQFDTQKLKNPNISGDLYQQGDQLGFWNVREFVFYRDKHKCQHCKGKSKDKILNAHHIESRKTGGDSPDNLLTLCETCHKYIHKNRLEHLFTRKSKSLRDATQMTVMRWFIYNQVIKLYPQTKLTYGFITKNTRIKNNLEKSHEIDARCISRNPKAKQIDKPYLFKQVRKNNRQLHKMTITKNGIRKNNKAPKLVKGFRLFDKVLFENKECFIFGRRSTGYFDLRTLDGQIIHRSASYKKLKLIDYSKSILIQQII